MIVLLPATLAVFALGFLGSTTTSRSGRVSPPVFHLPFRPGWCFGGFAIGIVTLVILSLTWAAVLRCPRCGVNLDTTQKFNFCPECGEDKVEKQFFLGPICRACDKRLFRGRGGRSYKIRYCPGCGARLDDAGVS